MASAYGFSFPAVLLYCQKRRQIYKIIIVYKQENHKHFYRLLAKKPACSVGSQGCIAAPDQSGGRRRQKVESFYKAVGIITLADNECIAEDGRVKRRKSA